MAKTKKNEQPTPEATEEVTPVAETVEETAETPVVNEWEVKYNELHDSYLRMAADYDNYRKRTLKEKELSYSNGKSDAVEKLLPVYDNLERALQQETQDEAYKKGVEMTMTQLVGILNGLGVEIFGNPGDAFDPNIHNAVMHIEDEAFGENTICQVFQKGFQMGEKIVRFAMVQVAN
ncbi:MAG: nucleotide exchange factor GrpE [Oscillospiraceae bacterium]|nr:nucleotide exchange factor GrpE [Oscillospiraceae bacterium]